ncbi:hypothetical protein IFR05_012432 [Cadophora sp. M221]|nr:hypothetical protein IFR05_012432 [Cadophora sp. M221]
MNFSVDNSGEVRSGGLVTFQNAESAKIAASKLTGVSLGGAVLQLEQFGPIPKSVSTSITKQPDLAMSGNGKTQSSNIDDAKSVVDDDVPRPLKRKRVETNVGRGNQSLKVTTYPANSTATKERLERDKNKLAKIYPDDETEARRNGFLRNLSALYETFENMDHCKSAMQSVLVISKSPTAWGIGGFHGLDTLGIIVWQILSSETQSKSSVTPRVTPKQHIRRRYWHLDWGGLICKLAPSPRICSVA